MEANEIIKTFRTAHQSIVNSIDQIQPLIRSYLVAKPKIREFHLTLLAYLAKENKVFFDKLFDYYHADRESTKMLEYLVHGAKDIKIKYLIFSEKHSGEPSDNNMRSFPLDFMEFSKELLTHIKIEEEYLFPLLEKIPATKDLSEDDII